MKIRPGVEVAGLSDVGCQRQNNEDRCLYWEPAADEEFRHKGRLAVIADGMGGVEGGQEASRIAVEAIQQVFEEAADGDPRSLLLAGFRAAHDRILREAGEDPQLQGMGTTCTALALLGSDLYFAHAGDSRLYLLRDSGIQRLTRDHTYVGRLVEYGILRQEDAASHPHKNILIMALGAGPEISPDSPAQPIALEKGDTVLLCTDGLWSMVSDEEMRSAITAEGLEEACRGLVATARERGGPDNITLQILRLV